MKIKSNLLKIANLFSQIKTNTNSMIKNSIKAEVSLISLKLMIGIIVTITVVASIIQFGSAFLILLSHYKFELYFKLISFGALISLGLIVLYLLFRMKNKKVEKRESMEGLVDLTVIACAFANGILEGYTAVIEKDEDLIEK